MLAISTLGNWNSVPCQCGLGHPSAVDEFGAPPLRVSCVFLVASRALEWGSTFLRYSQIVALLKAFDPSISVNISGIEGYTGKSDVVVITKSVLKKKGILKFVRRLQRRGSLVLLDLIDGRPGLSEVVDPFVAGFLCASESEARARSSQSKHPGRVIPFPHLIDLRLSPRFQLAERFRIGYIGNTGNARFLDEMPIDSFELVSPHSARNPLFHEFTTGLSHHYSVRLRSNLDGYKPPTKIFIAAHLGASFVGSFDDEETRDCLGVEYPYLARSSKFNEVRQIIEFARESFGGTQHEKSLSMLGALRSDFCPAKVVSALHETLQDLVTRG